MTVSGGYQKRFLMLGPDSGWHHEQLLGSARRFGCRWDVASWETLAVGVSTANNPKSHLSELHCDHGSIESYDGILVRTMPSASFERITFRLAWLHAIADGLFGSNIAVVNPPRALEWSIDKSAALMRLADLGVPTPATRFVQSRREAMAAYDELGPDCVVKPLFGGEGRGVIRVTDRELAWTAFSALDQLGSVHQIQAFVPPGGSDTRCLVIGAQVVGYRRRNLGDFRSNVSAGAVCEQATIPMELQQSARRIAAAFGMPVASVDFIDNDDGPPLVLEVNAIPGWKGGQSVLKESISDRILETLIELSDKENP